MENWVLLVTAVGRNGTDCPHCCQQHLERGPTVYKRKTRVSHHLSLWWCNLSALHINALRVHVHACEGSRALEQARRVRGAPRHLHHESARRAVHPRSRPPPDPAGTYQKPPGQHANKPTMPWEWSEESQLLPMPHQTCKGLLLSLQLAADIAHPLLWCQVSQQRLHIPLITKYTWNETARYQCFSLLSNSGLA